MLGAAAAVASLVVHARTAAYLDDSSELYLTDVWISIFLPPVGAYLIVRERATLLGWLFISAALTGFGQLGGAYGTHSEATGANQLLADPMTWLATWSWTPYLLEGADSQIGTPPEVPVADWELPLAQPASKKNATATEHHALENERPTGRVMTATHNGRARSAPQ